MGTNYRPITTDPEYLDNWVNSLGLLCETHRRVGFLGSSYFLGMMVAMTFVPAMGDYYGRKNSFIVSMFASCVAQLGLIYSTNLTHSTMLIFLLGISWPGKRVIGLNYALEFIPAV